MFEEEFKDLPFEVEQALKARLEEVVRQIYGRYNTSVRDYSIKAFSAEQVNAMIHSVFDLAQRLKPIK